MRRRSSLPSALLAFVILAHAVPTAAGPAPDSAPTAVIQAPASVGYGLDISVSGSQSFDLDGSIVRYIWTLDSQSPVVTASPSFTFDIDPAHPLAPGVHTVRLVVVDDSGLQSSPDQSQVLVLDGVAPTAVVSAPSSVAFGAGIAVSGSSSFDVGGAIIKYTWTLDSQPSVETADPSFTFAFDPANPFAVGTHTVRLVVTDDSGNQSSPDSAVVRVIDSLAPTAVISAPARVPFGQDIVVSGGSSFDIGGQITTYRWTLDGQPTVETADPDLTFHVDPASPLALGTHTVQLVVLDDSGNQSEPTVAQILVVDAFRPTAVITAPATVPVGQSVAVSGSNSFDPDGAIIRYTWTLDARPPVVTPDPSFTIAVDPANPLPVGPHTLQLVVTDDQGNDSEPDSARILVVDSFAPTAVLDAPPSVPFGQDIVVSGARSADVGGTIVRYQWTLDALPPVETTDPSFTFAADPAQPFMPGFHVVRLIVTDDSGNQSSPAEARVSVLDGTAPTAVITAPAVVGLGEDINVSGARSFDIGGTIVRYEWRLDGGAPVVTQGPAFVFTADPASPFVVGRHAVQLVVTDDAGNRSQPDSVDVLVTDNIAPTAVIDAPAQIVLGGSLTVSGARSFDIGGAVVRYDWRLDGQAPVSTAAAGFTFSGPGTPLPLGPHDVQLVVTDDSGNQSQPASARVMVVPPPDTAPPTIELTTPTDGAVYVLNQKVTACFACADADSGLASCVGTVSNGARIDTSVAGARTFTVTATDRAGNRAQVTRTYHVRYRFSGFLPPVHNLPRVNVEVAGRTIPVKWRLRDAAGAPLTSLTTFVSLKSSPIACDGSPDSVVEEQLVVARGVALRYDPWTAQFIFNWQTTKRWDGCRLLQLTLADGTKVFAKFRFR